MSAFIDLFISFWQSIINTLDRYTFNFWGSFTVSIMDLLMAILITGLVIGVFWKGAKT